jgi:hypothetical protein
MRRIVEEAALLGIPSIVLDPNNDLSRLDDAWPTRPESWSEEEVAKAQTYRARADVVIWTPGVTSGNPISLNLLPDFVIDEAQNFAPSGAGTACKASALSLAAQARKYGLGMMFATQTPKGVDNKIVSNCTTHIYGRMNAPATIDAIHDLMAAKGGTADDIGKLSKGEFYFSTEGSLRPFKVRTPLCLTWHPPNPPTAEEVIQKARSKRV